MNERWLQLARCAMLSTCSSATTYIDFSFVIGNLKQPNLRTAALQSQMPSCKDIAGPR